MLCKFNKSSHLCSGHLTGQFRNDPSWNAWPAQWSQREKSWKYNGHFTSLLRRSVESVHLSAVISAPPTLSACQPSPVYLRLSWWLTRSLRECSPGARCKPLFRGLISLLLTPPWPFCLLVPLGIPSTANPALACLPVLLFSPLILSCPWVMKQNTKWLPIPFLIFRLPTKGTARAGNALLLTTE